MFTRVKTEAEIAAMREGGQMLAQVLELLKQQIAVGMNTKQLADIAAKELKQLGGKPAFLGYEGFPEVLCVSINDEVVHGIPSKTRIIKDGDIVGLDFGVTHKGLITDGAISVIVGKSDNKRLAQLLKTTEAAMYAGIDEMKDGVKTGDIGAAVQAVLTKGQFGIIRDMVGHGVGDELHEDPNVPNYGSRGQGNILKKGMTVAIEPMATMGGETIFIAQDGWTINTYDGSLAAHFEHTVLITEDGAEILTTT